MGNISIKNWLEDNKSEMCYTYLGHRVKYGLNHFLDHFLDYFLDHFFGPFYRGKHTISTQGGVGMQSTSTEGGMEGRVLLLREG